MRHLSERQQTVSVAEKSTGGFISAALMTSVVGSRAYKGGGVRLPRGITPTGDADAKQHVQNDPSLPEKALGWNIVYDGGAKPESISAVHALELAHAAKFNLGAQWGIGQAGVVSTSTSSTQHFPPGFGFVAVAGPTAETTGVLKLPPSKGNRTEHMLRFAEAALDLMSTLQAQK
jgi:nicotinamide mononucleotide (NMN) deamidase PncC